MFSVAEDSTPPPPLLDNLFVSHGQLTFTPSTLHYSIPLHNHISSLEVVPVVDLSKYHQERRPSVHVGMTSSMTRAVPGVGVSLAVASLSELAGASAGSFDVIVEVSFSRDSYTQYKLTFTQEFAQPNTNLVELTVIDQDGDKVEASASLQEGIPTSQQLFKIYTLPKTTAISISGTCSDGSTALVDGVSGTTPIARDKTKANQLITVECRQQSKGRTFSRNYFLDVRTAAHDVPPPANLVVEDSGRACQMSSDEVPQFFCITDTSTVRLRGDVDPQYRYTVVNEDSGVHVRLLNDESTAAVPCNSGLYIHGTAGHTETSKLWPLRMNGVYFPAGGDETMQVVGWVVGLLLLTAVGALLFVLGLSNFCGLGTPFGASEIPSTLVFLLQYFCFANVLRGEPTLLSDSTSVLKWVTLWWPLPWDIEEGEVSVAHVANAQGCLFWCLLALVGCVLVHVAVWLKLVVIESGQFTYPHKLLPGNWEARVVHFLVLPAAAASLMLLCHPDSSAGSRVMGAFTFLALTAWTVLSFMVVRRVVKSRAVIWVWSHSLREDSSEAEAGYWSDAVCDQLNTEPANRSLCRSLFPWHWSSTVGDIEPTALVVATRTTSAGSAATTTDGDSPLDDGRRDTSSGVPISKQPRTVEVVRTRKPNARCCRGHQLLCGLFRTQWLDVLFTYGSLTNVYAYSQEHSVHTTVPLTVKTHQLAGAITSGYLCFFFDGVRIPFVRCGEFLFRLVIGATLGIVMAAGTGALSGICFMLVAAIAAGAFTYALKSFPFSRAVENWLLCSMLVTVAFSGVGFMGLSFAGHPNMFLDMLLWAMALVCIGLSAYSVFITFCIISAVLCPTAEEYRFLERLCNTDIVISDHSEGFKAEAMGYNRYGTRDIMVQCSSSADGMKVNTFPSTEDPSLELPVSDVLAACRSGQLPLPKVCLCMTSREDSLGYQHMNLYDRLNLRSRVERFVASESLAPHHSAALTNAILTQIDTRTYDTAVLSLTVIMPKNSLSSRSWASSRGISNLPSVVADKTGSVCTSRVGSTRGATSGGYDMPSMGGSKRGYSKLLGGVSVGGDWRDSARDSARTPASRSVHSQLEMRSRNY
eukprot:GHVS01106642.1.p1 GENE.GHVS01106642.1~~GHVS01106642.1.p1  ORF type:complete len:1118 (-),score=186.88 GHVS01106642.1:365-3646(-)